MPKFLFFRLAALFYKVGFVQREHSDCLEEFAMRLLEEEHVAVVPGTAFGDCGEGFLRISYAYSIEDLKIALERLGRFVKKLRQ